MRQVGSWLRLQLGAGSFLSFRSFRFDLRELGGGVGDVGTLFPLLLGLALVNGVNPSTMLLGAGAFYIASSLYYRLPLPVQPLKAASALTIALGLPAATLGAAGLLMGAILVLLAATGLISLVVKAFPGPVVRGIQLGVGLLLVQKGADLMVQPGSPASGVSVEGMAIPWGLALGGLALGVFLLGQRWKAVPASLAVLGLGLGVGVLLGTEIPWGEAGFGWPWARQVGLPGASNFKAALLLLVIPQLPLTLGNAIVATADAAKTYFGPRSHRVTPRALAAGMGLANLSAGLIGALPMCHGAGGLTAHYRLGARTGGATFMFGAILIVVALAAGDALLPLLSLIPLPVLGAFLVIVGAYHAFLARDLSLGPPLVVGFSVAVVGLAADNLALGFIVGLALYLGFRRLKLAGL